MTNDDEYFHAYDQFSIHELMLRDHSRVNTYHDAIMKNKHLFENKIILDVGSGTGILSMFAAKAGAKYVFAVDACPKICHIAKQLIQSNGFSNRIEIINKRIEDIEKFNENIDVIISEWMGFYLFHESMLESVIYARNHFSQNQSLIIFPSHAYLYCAPFVDENIRIESNSMWKNYFDLNFSSILPLIKNSDLTECVIETIQTSQLIQDGQLIQSIDLRTIEKDDLKYMHSFCQFDIDNTCIISGFCFWFDCYFSSSNSSSLVRLTTHPSALSTHWKQTLVFLPEDIYPLKDDVISVDIYLQQREENRRHYNLTIEIQDDQSIDMKSESEEEEEEEHPIPCSCDREKCKLIRMIMDKFDEENPHE